MWINILLKLKLVLQKDKQASHKMVTNNRS